LVTSDWQEPNGIFRGAFKLSLSADKDIANSDSQGNGSVIRGNISSGVSLMKPGVFWPPRIALVISVIILAEQSRILWSH
jgi:hypothetical protein